MESAPYLIVASACTNSKMPTVPTIFHAVRWRDSRRETSSIPRPMSGPATNTATKNASFQSSRWSTCRK